MRCVVDLEVERRNGEKNSEDYNSRTIWAPSAICSCGKQSCSMASSESKKEHKMYATEY